MNECILTFVKFSPEEGRIDEQDLSTIEFSKRLKAVSGWKLISASILKEGFEKVAARELYSRGVDEAFIYVLEEGEGDILSSAVMMKDIIEGFGCAAVVFGERSSDTSFGALGGYVSGLLNMIFLSFISEVVELKGGKIRAKCVPESELIVEADLPAILVPTPEAFPPSPVLMKDRLDARKKQPVVKRLNKAAPESSKLLRVRRPEERRRSSIELSSPEELARILKKVIGD